MSIEQPDPVEGHTAKAFDAALSELRLQLVAMGGLVAYLKRGTLPETDAEELG